MFELLANGTVEMLCNKFKKKGIPYGFGGIAKIGDGLLPAEKIIMEHYRLGSTRAILSRTFCNNVIIESVSEIDRVFKENMRELNSFGVELEKYEDEIFEDNKETVKVIVKEISNNMKEKKKKCIL